MSPQAQGHPKCYNSHFTNISLQHKAFLKTSHFTIFHQPSPSVRPGTPRAKGLFLMHRTELVNQGLELAFFQDLHGSYGSWLRCLVLGAWCLVLGAWCFYLWKWFGLQFQTYRTYIFIYVYNYK